MFSLAHIILIIALIPPFRCASVDSLMAVKFFGTCRIRINTQLSLFQMSQREKMTGAVSDVCTPSLTICWPVSFQIQFGTEDVYMNDAKRTHQ